MVYVWVNEDSYDIEYQYYSIYILNKSENATPELFAIYIQNYANQECKLKCILMFKYLVMHNSKKFYGCCHEETHENHLNVTGSNFSGC